MEWAIVLKFDMLEKLLLLFHRDEFDWHCFGREYSTIFFFKIPIYVNTIAVLIESYRTENFTQVYSRPRPVDIAFEQNLQSGLKFMIFLLINFVNFSSPLFCVNFTLWNYKFLYLSVITSEVGFYWVWLRFTYLSFYTKPKVKAMRKPKVNGLIYKGGFVKDGKLGKQCAISYFACLWVCRSLQVAPDI